MSPGKKLSKHSLPVVSFVGSAIASHLTQSHAAATDSMVEGMDAFRIAAEKLGAVNPKISQGNLFEYIEAAKFNADAALKGSNLKAEVTAAMGDPHAAADLLIKEGDRTLQAVQAKSMNRASNATAAISQEKYRGMQKLVPSDQAERVQELAQKRADRHPLKAQDYRDTAKNVTGELKAGKVSSGGTTYPENLKAAQSPKLYAAAQELRAVGKEAIATGGQAAIAGGIIAGTISAVKNGLSVRDGHITLETAVQNTAQDATKAALRSGATGATSSMIRYGATKAGIRALGKSNVAVTVAASGIDIGVSVLQFAKGEISAQQLQHQVGQTGTCTLASLYAGAAVGSVCGPVGTVVGSIGGYLVAGMLYESSTSILSQAQLAQAEAERVTALAEAASLVLRQERQRFETEFAEAFQVRCAELDACFDAIATNLNQSDPLATSVALSQLALTLGHRLPFERFEDFDAFMEDPDTVLQL